MLTELLRQTWGIVIPCCTRTGCLRNETESFYWNRCDLQGLRMYLRPTSRESFSWHRCDSEHGQQEFLSCRLVMRGCGWVGFAGPSLRQIFASWNRRHGCGCLWPAFCYPGCQCSQAATRV